ncbi:WD40 repeat-like protein [Glarea lozoyensis ATCC 20868]|uniref:WD40 repeat-like protein n=1 Tax=Glarea lozoyensis (strain ATCC 20868 / MF5171) TaxID=1116229 RepID=S3CXC5_GLAL2|nr:WD40 repeat-like protein [Glarea lozoyensis ATCC 20868]EPE29584.1 WD40 repeat-like protein [Glarea lozoyensis ATCC 20868]
MPYQCIDKRRNLLIAARDSSIDLINLENGSYLSTWTCPWPEKPQISKPEIEQPSKLLATQESQSSSVDIVIDSKSPPAKRRKLSSGEADKDLIKEVEPETQGTSTAKVTKNGNEKNQKKQKQNNRSVAIAIGLEAPAIIALAVTVNNKHVVAVTGEDKCIRVFEIVDEADVSKLHQVSERIMPKRPSSIAITPDSATILSADKFGDVYSLPLIPSLDQDAQSATPIAERPFKPSANEKTIHSQRNRIALENQKRHHNSAPKNQLPTFEHTLLLGHVSLLIDLKLATLEGKTYIITSDRDEHIRISRGIPQAHVIESFCLGHREFVSRLCIPTTRPGILVSGGGDDEIYVWKWKNAELLCKADLKTHVNEIVSESAKEKKIAVSGIYHTNHEGVDFVLVTVEAIPGIFVFKLIDTTLTHVQNIFLRGNALGVVTTPSRVITSIDTIHTPASTIELRSSDKPDSSFVTFKFTNGVLEEDSDFKIAGVKDSEIVDADSVENKRMKNLLYSIENLRKRVGEIDGGEAEDG